MTGPHWHAYAVVRALPETMAGVTWTANRIAAGWELELSGDLEPDWSRIAPDVLSSGILADPPTVLVQSAPEDGIYRAVAFDGDCMCGAILVDRAELSIDRGWLALRLDTPLDAAERFRLLSGRPSGYPRPRGETICYCRDVGINEVVDAIAAGCTTLEAIGARTTAGTNCGNCQADLERLIAGAAMNAPR